MTEKAKPLVVSLVGPTCTGKTALSLQLANILNAEILACDSRTIYRFMDIGTAKPSKAEQAEVPHHMLDVANPNETFTVAQFKSLATDILHDIISRGKLPIVCGGTGFYARALLEGLDIPAVPPQIELRSSLNELADKESNQALHNRLQLVDPITAQKLNPNDRFRIVRALEVFHTTGQPFSQLIKLTEPPFRIVWIGLTIENRDHLRESIKARLETQLQQGLVSEVEDLLNKYGTCRTLVNTVNYKEFIDLLKSKAKLNDARELCLLHNYQLARKQLIWFRANQDINWFSIDTLQKSELLKLTVQKIKENIS